MEDFKVTDNSRPIIKVKAIKDFDIIKGIASFKKDEEYEFTYDENFDKYLITLSILDGGFITLCLPKSDIDKHFYTEKEPTLEEKYAKELAEVERLFPEGKKGTFTEWYGRSNLTCKRKGVLRVFNHREGHVCINTYHKGAGQGKGILWSTKHGYSTPNVKEKAPLEICKEKYKEGTKIRSLNGNVVVLSENNVKKLYCNGGDVYTNHGDYVLYRSELGRYTEIVEEPTPNKPTFGEKLVGKSFNPSKDSKVDKLKSLFAEITDIVNEHSEEMPTDILNKDFGIIQSSIYLSCLTDILKAQMLSVKFVTLQKD